MSAPEPHTAHDGDRVPLGQLLVDQGLLAQADLERLLEEQRRTGAPLGRMLVEGGFLAGSTVAMALAEQHGGLLKTEYGFATGRTAAQRAAAVNDAEGGAAPPLPPVASLDSPAAGDSASLSPLLFATEQAPGPDESVETRRPDLELARATAPEAIAATEPPPVIVPLTEPIALEPLLFDEPALVRTPPVVADDRDLIAGQLAAAELERDALRDRLDEAHLARRTAEEAAQSSAERLAFLQTDADAASAALTIARDELEDAQSQIAELTARLAVPQEDRAAREALASAEQRAEESAVALAEARVDLAAAQAQIAELAAQREDPATREALASAEQRTEESSAALAQAQAGLAAAQARIAELEAQPPALREDFAAGEALASAEQRAEENAAALAQARAGLAAAQARIAELEAVDIERIGADIAHQTLVSLQQESEVAAAELTAARDELEAARARIAELSSAQADEAQVREQLATLDARTRELQSEVATRDARIAELESRLVQRADIAEQSAPAEHSYDESNHVLLVPSESGYVTLERPGPAPQNGDPVVLPLGRYQVARRGASPFPSDTRGCAYLIRA